MTILHGVKDDGEKGSMNFEETLKKHETKPSKNEFGESEMLKWWLDKDYLGIPGEKTISKDMAEDEITDMIYRDIG